MTSQAIREAIGWNRDEYRRIDNAVLPTTKEKGDIDYLEDDPDIYSLFENSMFIPKESELKHKSAFIKGGIRFGGRYPDVIINKYDYERAKNLLTHKLGLTTTNVSKYIQEIVQFVKHVFKTENAVKYDFIDGRANTNQVWTDTIDTAAACIYKILPKPNSFTNITALPYVFGDCREHAILTTFLCNVYADYLCETEQETCNQHFRILYTRCYLVNEDTHSIDFLEEHVFGLYFMGDYYDNAYIIDALYETNDTQLSREHDRIQITFVDKNKYETYTQPDEFRNATVPVIHSGNMNVNGTKRKVFSIPIIWKNEIEFIDNAYLPNNKYDKIMIYNRVMDYDAYETIWQSHSEWCNDMRGDIALGKKRKKRMRLTKKRKYKSNKGRKLKSRRSSFISKYF